MILEWFWEGKTTEIDRKTEYKSGAKTAQKLPGEARALLHPSVSRPRGGGRGRGKPLSRREEGGCGKIADVKPLKPRGLVGLRSRPFSGPHVLLETLVLIIWGVITWPP